MAYYAEVDKNGIAYHVGDLSFHDGDKIPDNLIPLTDGNMNVLGKKYEKGTWVDYQPPISAELKLQEINEACQDAIYTGVDVKTSLGIKHFSLTEADQLNLTGVAAQLEKALLGRPQQ